MTELEAPRTTTRIKKLAKRYRKDQRDLGLEPTRTECLNFVCRHFGYRSYTEAFQKLPEKDPTCAIS